MPRSFFVYGNEISFLKRVYIANFFKQSSTISGSFCLELSRLLFNFGFSTTQHKHKHNTTPNNNKNKNEIRLHFSSSHPCLFFSIDGVGRRRMLFCNYRPLLGRRCVSFDSDRATLPIINNQLYI